MPLLYKLNHLLLACLCLLPLAASGQVQHPFKLAEGVEGNFTISLKNGDKEYSGQQVIDLSSAPDKTLTLTIQVGFTGKGSQGYVCLFKRSNLFYNKKVLELVDGIETTAKRNNPQPLKITFSVIGEGPTGLGFDYFSLKDEVETPAGKFSKTYTISLKPKETPVEQPVVTPTPAPPAQNNRPRPQPAPAQQDPDEAAYKKCGDDDLECLEDYLARFGQEAKYRKKAQERIRELSPLKFEIIQDSVQVGLFQIILENAIKPVIDTIIGDISEEESDFTTLEENGRFFVKPLSGAQNTEVSIRIVDKGKPKGKPLLINLQKILFGKLSVFPDSLVQFEFGGVAAPYQVFLRDTNNIIRYVLEFNSGKDGITYEELRKDLKQRGIEWGRFNVEAYSEDAGNTVRFKDQIFIPKPEGPDLRLIGGIAGAALLAFLLYQLYRAQQRKKFKKLLEEKKKTDDMLYRQEEPVQPADPPAPAPATQTGEENAGEEPRQEKATPPPPPPPAKSQPVVPGDIRIRAVRSAAGKGLAGGMRHDQFEDMIREEIGTVLLMDTHWADSAVTQIHFGKKAIGELDRFLREQNIHDIEEKEGNIPEIGGFLLGQYFLHEDQTTYDLAILHFVPVHPENHDIYRLEFNVESLATRLGDVQDQYPQYALVGWFHTHPGHGLFLSKPDLTIHEGFFNRPYQVAMEIDSLTQNLDTAFFTRHIDGKVFNIEQRKPGTHWFAWTEIEKATRKRKSS